MTITDLELEQISEADKKAQRKANTLGADRPLAEEPFGNSSIVLKEDLFARTPTAATGFAAPDYGDAPTGGAVATRHVDVRLHPLAASGQTGLDSIQTFMVVSATPESDDPVDIERVRIKHLVPPDLSIGRSHAAEDDGYLRGFEMALYPAYPHPSEDILLPATRSTQILLGLQDGYFDAYQIPLSADPGAQYGIGSSGRITVDYANGIVRLSCPPLLGPEVSIINPFDMYGDRDGYRVDYGRPILFATFYQYTGPNLSQAGSGGVNLVTVGDGSDSYGSFYGPSYQVMQEAVDSLWPLGGTVFVSGGTYRYDEVVTIPENVSVVGLSPNAKIYSQSGSALFRFIGSNSSVRGLQLFSQDVGAIEFGSDVVAETLENILVSDNIIWSFATSKGVTFAPQNASIIYKNCRIENNQFKTTDATTTYIGQTSGGSSLIDGLSIVGNTFDNTTGVSQAIDLSNSAVTSVIKNLTIGNNRFGSLTGIDLNNGAVIDGLHIYNNTEALSLGMYGVVNANMEDSAFASNVTIYTSGADGLEIRGSELGDFFVDGYVIRSSITSSAMDQFTLEHSANNFRFADNTVRDNAYFRAKALDLYNVSLDNVQISNSKFVGGLHISNSAVVSGVTKIQDLVIDKNVVQGGVTFAQDAETSADDIVFDRLKFTNNTVTDGYSVVFGDILTGTNVIMKSLLVQGNILNGDLGFYDTVDFNTDFVSTIEGNTFDNDGAIFFTSTDTNNVKVMNNKLSKIIFFGDSGSDTALIGSGTSSNLVITNNILFGSPEIIFCSINATPLTLDNVEISNNTFIGSSANLQLLNTGTATNDYRITHLTISGNILPDSSSTVVIGPSTTLSPGGVLFTDCVITDNDVNGTLTVGGIPVTRLKASGNIFAGGIVFDKALSSSNISNNTFTTISFDETTSSCIFSNNNGASVVFSGAATSVTAEGNSLTAGLTFSSTLTNCNVNGNRIGGTLSQGAADNCTFNDNVVNAWTSTTWDNSTFVGNAVAITFSATTVNDTSFKDSRIEGNATLTTITNSSLGGLVVKGATGLTITSLDTCTLNNSVIANTLSVVSTINTSTVSGNRIDTFSVAGLIDNSTIANNVTVTGGASLSSASVISDSTITGNSFQSTNTNAAFVAGTITDCTITGNIFKSTNGGAAVTTFGNMLTTAFDANNIEQAAAGAVSFGTITESIVSGLVIDATAVTCGSITHTEIVDAYIDATFTVSSSTFGALVESGISNSSFVRDFTLAMTTLDITPAVVSARLLNNHFEAGAFINGAFIAFRDSIVTGNNFKNNFNIHVTTSGGTYALEDTVLSNNRITSALLINNTSGTAANANMARRSIISSNEIGSDCLIGANAHITNATFLFEEVNFNSNHIAGNLILGPAGRTASLTTYISSSFNGNTVGGTGGFGDLIVRGAMVGCAFGDNILNNNSTFDLVSGGTMVANVFGADGNGTVTLAGGLQNNAVFSNNFAVGNVTVSDIISSAVLSNNTINGELELNGAVSSSDLSNNIISGLLDINNTVTSTTISDNTLVSAVDFSTTVSGSIMSDNILSNTLTINGAITGLNMSGNYSTSSLTLVAGVTNLNMSENRFGAVSMNSASTKSEIALGNNTLSSLTINNSTLTTATIQGNRISGAVNLSTSLTMTNSVFNDNACGSTVAFGTLSRVGIDGNFAASDFNFDGTVSYAAISNNTVNDMIFDLAVDQSQILGNNTATDMTFSSTITGTTLVGNVIGADGVGDFAALGAITDCMFSANDFRHVVTFPAAAVTSVTFTGNHVGGTFIDSGTGGTHTYTGFTISSNTFDSSITLEGQMSKMQFANNYVAGAALFDSSVSGGTVVNSVISGNMFDGSLTIANDGASAAPLITSTISNNRIDTTFAITASGGTGGGACNEAVIEGNTIGSTTTLTGLSAAIMTDSVFRDNTCQGVTLTGAVTLAGLVNTIVSGNVIDGDINIHTGLTGTTAVLLLNESIVSNNTVDGSIFMGSSGRDGDSQTYFESIVSGNTCIVMTMYGRLDDVDLVGNIISGSTGNLTVGGMIDTRVSGNVVNNTTGTTDTIFGFNAATNPVILNCIISDNDFFENVDINQGSITGTRIMNNRFAGSFDATGVIMTTVNIGGNYFGGTFLTGQWSSVSCMGNQFVGAFTLSATVNTVIDDVSFQVNVCQSTVTFARPASGTSSNFVESSFTGNVFDGTVSFGTDTFTNEMVRIVFNSNSGAGGLTFYTGASTEMDSCMIVGNNMDGTFTIDDNAGGTYPSPPTSGGTAQFILALNWFSGYNGVAFTDSQAIGWGDNLAGTAITTVVGSNLS